METKITLEPWKVIFNTSNLEEAEEIVRAMNSRERLIAIAQAIVDQSKDGISRMDWILAQAKDVITEVK